MACRRVTASSLRPLGSSVTEAETTDRGCGRRCPPPRKAEAAVGGEQNPRPLRGPGAAPDVAAILREIMRR
jgi:hypothetical protein